MRTKLILPDNVDPIDYRPRLASLPTLRQYLDEQGVDKWTGWCPHPYHDIFQREINGNGFRWMRVACFNRSNIRCASLSSLFVTEQIINYLGPEKYKYPIDKTARRNVTRRIKKEGGRGVILPDLDRRVRAASGKRIRVPSLMIFTTLPLVPDRASDLDILAHKHTKALLARSRSSIVLPEGPDSLLEVDVLGLICPDPLVTPSKRYLNIKHGKFPLWQDALRRRGLVVVPGHTPTNYRSQTKEDADLLTREIQEAI